MKRFLAPADRKPIDKPTAWACTVTNLVTLPGLGTLAGGRRIGYVQGVLALVGFVLSGWGGIGLIRSWMAEGELPLGFTPDLIRGLVGIIVYGTAWLWSLGSSVAFHREAKANEASRVPPHLPPKG